MAFMGYLKLMAEGYEPTGYSEDGRFNIARYLKDLEVKDE